jgi:hypothetical protein
MRLVLGGMALKRTQISCSAPFLWLNYSTHSPQSPNLRLPTINRLEGDTILNLAKPEDPNHLTHGISSPDETYPMFSFLFSMFLYHGLLHRPNMYIRLLSLSVTIHLDSMRCDANRHYNILYNLSFETPSFASSHSSLPPFQVPKHIARASPDEPRSFLPNSSLDILPMSSIFQMNFEVVQRFCWSQRVDPSGTILSASRLFPHHTRYRNSMEKEEEETNLPIQTLHSPFLRCIGLINGFRSWNNIKCVLWVPRS